MSKFVEYIESWKEHEKFLQKRMSLLQEDLWQILPKVSEKLKSLGATEVIIFGSLVEGDFKLDSDVDIAVIGMPKDKYIEALLATEKIITPLHIDFDLVFYETAYPWIKEKIQKGKKL